MNVAQDYLTVDHVLLDNGADVSVFHPTLLRDVQTNTVKVRVNGLGGRQLLLTDEGYLPEFFTVYASEHTTVNILSLADVEALCTPLHIPHALHLQYISQRET
jgi:hypothetical protein